ncbi:MAG TPA: pyridoxamine 5'-phosphate oxidase family protein [Pyrinomonadaceae bacterium]|nr:pyridoxamine 5'-phosphate oxidase family protein [Pyrinomonadaceae bacterium]
MPEVTEMGREEMEALLRGARYGHLGCARDGQPYVVPMSFAYEGGAVYLFTTEGTKTEYMAANHEVCFQVEEVEDETRWRSVMLSGRAERLTAAAAVERAMQLLTARNPRLAPALSETRIGGWKRPTRIAVYRIRAEALYGRKTS